MRDLSDWDTFYVIVGSAAGALIGLQFVVMTLLAARPTRQASAAASAFATPTVVHFSTVLLLSALLRAPWQSITLLALLLGLIAIGSIFYMVSVVRSIRFQSVYRPDREDWLFHAVLPLAAYALLLLSALAAYIQFHDAFFGVGALALVLLFTGIHNAWDAVAYHVTENVRDETAGQRPDNVPPPD
jgi:hypothetical protein